MNQLKSRFNGQKVLVFGLGLQGGGLGDALWLNSHGASVRVTDIKGEAELGASVQALPESISRTLGSHRQEDIDWADIIIKNPGVSDAEPHILEALGAGKLVTTSIALVIQELRDKIVGITGTRGKSTTTELIYQILSSAYPGEVVKGGNIPGTSSLGLLDVAATAKYLVLELSSFQLHSLHLLQASPRVALLTNIYEDHLNRYPSMQAYQEDKEAIFRYQQEGDIALRNVPASLVPESWHLILPGAHNRENVAAALAVTTALGVSLDLIQQVAESFRGLPFRLETVATKRGVTYINDTTSTTPVASQAALAALTRPTVIIMGGASKNLDFTKLVHQLAASEYVTAIVLLGSKSIAGFIHALETACLGKLAGRYDSMAEAVQHASILAKEGSQVLLSPGFSSFDLFKNEFDRGTQFNSCVKKLPE